MPAHPAICYAPEVIEMANENKKDFNAMLHDSKDMPKFRTITDQASIEKYGGDRMYFAPPIDYDRVMRQVPEGKVITVGEIRDYFAKVSGADFTEPITAGIFVSIAAWASERLSEGAVCAGRGVMSKYDLLWKYVAEEKPDSLTFDDVEKICGFPIDHSFLTYKKELDEYGFKVGKISMKEKTISFESEKKPHNP